MQSLVCNKLRVLIHSVIEIRLAFACLQHSSVRIEFRTSAFYPGEEAFIHYTVKNTEEKELITMIFVSGTDEGKCKDRRGRRR